MDSSGPLGTKNLGAGPPQGRRISTPGPPRDRESLLRAPLGTENIGSGPRVYIIFVLTGWKLDGKWSWSVQVDLRTVSFDVPPQEVTKENQLQGGGRGGGGWTRLNF